MMSESRWGLSASNPRLFLCSLGIHKFYYCLACKGAERDSARNCGICGLHQIKWYTGKRSITPPHDHAFIWTN